MNVKIEKLKNLTPHTINLVRKDGSKVEIPSSGVIRVTEVTHVIGEIDGVKIISKHLSEIPFEAVKMVEEILKDPEAGVIVSLIAAKALMKEIPQKLHDRIFIVGNTVRDSEGKVIGADALTPASTL